MARIRRVRGSWNSHLASAGQRPQPPRTVVVAAREPALGVGTSQLEQFARELRSEEQITEELAADRVEAGVERASEQRDIPRSRGSPEAGVVLAVHAHGAFPDLVARRRSDEDVRQA